MSLSLHTLARRADPAVFERAMQLLAASQLDKRTRECSYGICYAVSRAQGDVDNTRTPEHALLKELFNRNDDGCMSAGYWWAHAHNGEDYGARLIALQLAACVARSAQRDSK